MMRFILPVLFLVLVGPVAASAEKHSALILADAAYDLVRPLKNTAADAAAMKEALEALGLPPYYDGWIEAAKQAVRKAR